MPRSRSASKPRSRRPASSPPPALVAPATSGDLTGKFLVLLRDNGIREGLQAIRNASGLVDVCNTSDYAGAAVEIGEANSADVFVLDKLKVAVVSADPSQAMGIRSAVSDSGAILAVEPERIMYALVPTLTPPQNFPLEYLRGYRDAVEQLYAVLAEAPAQFDGQVAAAGLADNAQFTWGLQATRTSTSPFSGRGIKVAVLDTGFDLDHPDFTGRSITSQSFVPGQAVNDLHGHGTHCIGTCLGSHQPITGVRRYGCAYHADIFAGKVLSNQGSGSDTGILAGINWAIANGCRIVSMSLGAPVQPGEPFSVIYENVAQRALQSNPGTIIIAAAGNESMRPSLISPVGRPANCPSIFAVAAVDNNMQVARFSNGGLNPNGGGVDVAGPGVGVFSSVPDPFPANVQPNGGGRPWPPRHHSIAGTSMATPHVAGIAALWLEARGNGTTAQLLWQMLSGNALRLSMSSSDIGAGLVQAPA